MRQLIIQVSRGHGKAVLDLAKSHGGKNLSQIEAQDCDELIDLVRV